MKKIVLVLFAAIMLCGCGTSAGAGAEYWTITGRYCETTNKKSLLLSEKEGAICISPAKDDNGLLDGLENGDEIEITVDGLEGTYRNRRYSKSE